MGEMLVGSLLPAAGPHQLEQRRQLKQVSGRSGRKEVGYAVDRMKGAVRPATAQVDVLNAPASPFPAAEQRDHAVDIDHQQRPGLLLASAHRLFSLRRGLDE